MPSASNPKKLNVTPTPNWQELLVDSCREHGIPAPVYREYSDRRGGRTAWSSTVTVHGTGHSARFWYDGKNLYNAKEDAAEVAYNWLNPLLTSSPSSTGW
ncbi:hypothetical protein RB595_002853 [Gaeumannomyces hyphopodioides]